MQNKMFSPDKKDADSERRQEILAKLKAAASQQPGRKDDHPAWRVPARENVNPFEDLDKLLNEIKALGGCTRKTSGISNLQSALSELVRDREIKSATCWENPQMKAIGIENLLQDLGVEMISPHADKYVLAGCDLGVTGADCALPESGTLMLCSSHEQPLLVSLLPRVHLAILDPHVIREDIAQAFEEFRGQRFVCITGPSRTADIELTLSIGVHGPKVLEVWALDQS